MLRRSPITNDPVFGELLLNSAWWSGEVEWPHGPSRTGVMIFRAPEKPNEEDRRAFAAIRETYSELQPKIAQALFSLWEAVPPNANQVGARPSTPAELLALLRLECICIDPSARVELLYEGNGGLFTVGIEEGNVLPHAFDGGWGVQERT
jgi:hypothetical protein